MANVNCELVWTRDLLTELGFAPDCPTRLYCDSQVVHISKTHVFYERTKHIEVDCHLIRQKMIEACSNLTCFIR